MDGTLVAGPIFGFGSKVMANIDKFIAGEDVWAKLQALAKSASGAKYVATGYLGDGAGKLLGLGAGDVLAVALSKRNAKNGCVSPKEVRRLIDRGVEVCIDQDLHAKVYLFGNVLVVGSPNLSKHSLSTLHEACLLTRDIRAIRSARKWFRQLRAAPVTPAWLDACLAVYTPPQFPQTRGARPKSEKRLWLVGLSHMDFPEGEAKECLLGEKSARRKVRAGYEVEILRFTGSRSLFLREVKPGNLVIQKFGNIGRSSDVHPVGRVVGVRRINTRRGTQVKYVYVEVPVESHPISWAKFRRGMAAVGVPLGLDVTTREIKGQRAIRHALSLINVG
jgi:PLD-like domain